MEKKIKPLKFNMSYSALNTYINNEKQFYLSKIIGAEESDKTIECYGNAGNVVHDAIEQHILGNDFNFTLEWDKMGLNTQYDFRGQTLNLSDYYTYATYGINFIKELRDSSVFSSNLIPEMEFNFPYEHNSNVIIKGFIDLVSIDGNNVSLFDWKTNSKATYEDHKKQRLFYSWAYWKVNGIIPMQAVWDYLRLEKIEMDSFLLSEIMDFEVYLYSIIDEIIEKGYDVTKYSSGKSSPFNGYKTLIESIDKGTIEVKDIKIRGKKNMVCEIKSPSREQQMLKEIIGDKYSKGAMIGAYMNHWVKASIDGTLDKLPHFNDFVAMNVRLKIELMEMEL